MSYLEEAAEVGNWIVFQYEVVSYGCLKYIRSYKCCIENTKECQEEVLGNNADVQKV